MPSLFECTCACGKSHRLDQDQFRFVCECGRPSLLDWGMGYSERELVAALTRLDVMRDRLVRLIELRRDKCAA